MVEEKKLNTKQKAVLKAVEQVLLAKRSGNVKREQTEHEKFEKLCEKYNLDPSDTMATVKTHIRTKTINAKGL